MDISDRRSTPRAQSAAKNVVVWLDSKTPRKGRLVDESLRGIGLEFVEQFRPELNQVVSISYNGVNLEATVRNIGKTHAGHSRIGFEWIAKGFSRALRPTTANSISEFFEQLPSCMFRISEFFENEKWSELGETAERLQSLANRCGVPKIEAPLQQLLQAIDLPNPREPSRHALHSLIEQCQGLEKDVVTEDQNRDDEVVDEVAYESVEGSIDESVDEDTTEVEDQCALVESLLQSIAKTTNEITIRSLSDGLLGILPNLPQDAIEDVFHQIMEAMHGANATCTVQSLSSTLHTITDRLPPEVAETVFHRIVSCLDNVDDAESVANLSSALNSVAEKISDEAAERILAEILSNLQEEHEPETLTTVLATVAERLSIEAAARVVPRLIDTIQQSDSECMRRSLTQTLQVLMEKLPSQEVQKIFHQIIVALEKTNDDYTLQCLAQALSSVTERLPAC